MNKLFLILMMSLGITLQGGQHRKNISLYKEKANLSETTSIYYKEINTLFKEAGERYEDESITEIELQKTFKTQTEESKNTSESNKDLSAKQSEEITQEQIEEVKEVEETEESTPENYNKPIDDYSNMPNGSIMVKGEITPLNFTPSFDELQSAIDNNPNKWTYVKIDRKVIGDGKSFMAFRHKYTGGDILYTADSIIYKDYNGNVGEYKLTHYEEGVIGDSYTPSQRDVIFGNGGEVIALQTCTQNRMVKIFFFSR